MIDPGVLRCKYVCAEYGRIVVALLVLVSAVAFGASAWVYTHPETEQVTEEAYRQTVETGVDTRTVVTGETPLWEEGTVLENRPFYPTRAAPNLTIHVRTSVPEGQPVRVSHRVSIVYRVRRGDATVWRSERTLDRSLMRVSDGEAVSSITIAIPTVRSRVDELSGALTGIGDVEVSLRLNASYQTNRYAGKLSASSPLRIAASGYWLGGDLSARKTHTTTVTRKVTDRDEAAIGGLAVLGLLAAIGAGVSARFYYDGPEGREIKRRIDQERCLEWISEGRIPQAVGDQDIEMHTLEDLVDVAIDSKNRVVYDPDRDLYAVVDLDLLYYYDPASTGTGRRVRSPDEYEQPTRRRTTAFDRDADRSEPDPSVDSRADRREGTDLVPRSRSDAVRTVNGNGNGNGHGHGHGHGHGSRVDTVERPDGTFARQKWHRLLDGNGADPGDAAWSDDGAGRARSHVADGGTDPETANGFGRDRWEQLFGGDG